MSTTSLSNIQEIIERTIFETIRAELVDKGYLPDITSYPDTPTGAANYQTAKETIVSTKGFCIEVFNEGSNYHKGNKAVPRIVLKSGNFLSGELGGDPVKYFIDNGTNYSSKVTPPQTADYFINIHLVSNTVVQERILNAILSLAIPKRKYLKWYSDSTHSFFIRHLNFFDIDDLDHGIIEKVFAYEIPDCWDMEDVVIDTVVAKINEIKVYQLIQKYSESPISESTDILTVS